ncbi:MAG: hypothetical protein U0996_06175 [Planctomycetaceae bacterium]
MTAADRAREFQDSVNRQVPGIGKRSANYGVSNIARFVDGGLLVGIPNLDGFNDEDTFLLTISRLDLAPGIEFHFAMLVQSEIETLRSRLADMTAAAAQDIAQGEQSPFYSDRNNNVSIYLGVDGKSYTRNRKASAGESLSDMLSQLGQGLDIDCVYYSIHEPTLQTRTHPLVLGVKDELLRIVGREKLIELDVWASTPTITAEMRRRPTALTQQQVIDGIQSLGGQYDAGVVGSFHTGLNYLDKKHFAILSGVSGTGKTSLVTRYASLIHDIEDPTEDPLYFVCAVRPDWTDPTGLLGYFDVFSNQYVVPTFLNAVFHALAYPDSAVIICLDEMNIARVEYYFADVLSAMETGLPLRLHSSEIAHRGDTGVIVPSKVPWPDNLYIVGTINIDETTNPLSDKVLDRAIVIDMSEIDLVASFESMSQDGFTDSVEDCRDTLSSVYAILAEHQLGFGRRTAIEVIRYMHFAKRQGAVDANAVLDSQLVQKVFPKLRGTERQSQMLTEL